MLGSGDGYIHEQIDPCPHGAYVKSSYMRILLSSPRKAIKSTGQLNTPKSCGFTSPRFKNRKLPWISIVFLTILKWSYNDLKMLGLKSDLVLKSTMEGLLCEDMRRTDAARAETVGETEAKTTMENLQQDKQAN